MRNVGIVTTTPSSSTRSQKEGCPSPSSSARTMLFTLVAAYWSCSKAALRMHFKSSPLLCFRANNLSFPL